MLFDGLGNIKDSVSLLYRNLKENHLVNTLLPSYLWVANLFVAVS
jgi:hypothetical protein